MAKYKFSGKSNFKTKKFGKKKFIYKFKLLKKFRFWRSFKKIFLRKKRKNFFLRFVWLFNNKRILLHHFKAIYGYSLKKLVFTPCYKYCFNAHLFDFFSHIEMLLYVLLVRVKFYLKIIESLSHIKKKILSINGNIIVYPKYLVSVGDILQKCRLQLFSKRLRFYKYLWRRDRWKKVKYKRSRLSKKRYISIYKFSKKKIYLLILYRLIIIFLHLLY